MTAVEPRIAAAELMYEALGLMEKYAPLSGDMALMIRASQGGGKVAHEQANNLVDFYENLNEAHAKAHAALAAYKAVRP